MDDCTPFRPVTYLKHEQISYLLAKLILSGAYTAGMHLPARADLCKQYGADVETIDMVAAILLSKRLIARRGPSCFQVLPEQMWNLLDVEVLDWVSEMPDAFLAIARSFSQVQYALDPELAAAAAISASPHDVAALAAACAQIERAEFDPVGAAEGRLLFSEILTLSANNQIALALYSSFNAIMRRIFQVEIMDAGVMAVHYGHIVEAIRKGDAGAARRAMTVFADHRKHFDFRMA